MSELLLLKSNERDLGGGLRVRRYLPSADKQSVGPFVFFDHFGPLQANPHENHDVRPHPHIGLATVSYLFEGALLHRDNLGSVQRIEPGAINWMTAGRGIVHSERTPPDLVGVTRRLHGLQLWVALPQAHEEAAPAFEHTDAATIPALMQHGAEVRVLVGRAFGAESPVHTLSETLYLDVALPPDREFILEPIANERAIYPVAGELRLDDQSLPAHTMAVVEKGRSLRLRADARARFVVIGGEPLDGPRLIWWNFVSSRKERMREAAEEWAAQRMPRIPGETEWIPLPEKRPW